MVMNKVRERWSQIAGNIKATLAIVVTVALASADYYDAIPLQPLLQQLFGEHAATKLTIYLPIIFGTLRFVSSRSSARQEHEQDYH